MEETTKIDLAGYVTIPKELRWKYGLRFNTLADVTGTEAGLLLRKAVIMEDSQDSQTEMATHINHSQPSPSVGPDPVKRWPDEGVEYCEDTDTLLLGDGLVIEQAAEKLRQVLSPMLRYLDEYDERAAANAPKSVLEDIIRISPDGQIKVAREFRYQYGLHPNAEVEITDTGDGLLIRKVADSGNPADLAYGSIPPGGIVDQLGGTDAYVRWIRGR